MYAAHMDGYIYKYYSDKINEQYNIWAAENFVDECVTAYRNNRKGKSNIHCAFDVFSYIADKDSCYIMVGDYSGFFDSLDHSYLKQRIQDLLGEERLPEDYYKVFKSITKYSYIEKDDVERKLKEMGEKTQNKYFENIKDFRRFKRETEILKRNPEQYGIPQGSSISAVLANVYMMKVDKKIHEIVSAKSGIYRRYSDDFIIVIPGDDSEEIASIEQKVKEIVEESHLKLQQDKTKVFRFIKKSILELGKEKRTSLDYLGFCFDGEKVTARQRSIYKFYRNAYKAIRIAQKRTRKKGRSKLIGKRKIYALYTDLGQSSNVKYKYKRKKYRGNFILYMRRAEQIFKKNNRINSMILHQIKHRKKKIFDRCVVKNNIRIFK